MYATAYSDLKKGTKPNFESKKTVILSFVIPFTVYPAFENPHPTNPDSLLGKPLKAGSHYILTNKKGDPAQLNAPTFYDELGIL